MSRIAITSNDNAVPAEAALAHDADALSAALRQSYEAGRAEAAAEAEETFESLRRSIRGLKRSLRRARPTPRQEVEAALDLMLVAVEERLGIESVIREHNGQQYRVYA